MSLMSLFRPLTPREMAGWTIRIYRQYWPRWIGLAAMAVLPPLALNLALSASQTETLDPALLDEVMRSLEQGLMPDEATLQALTQGLVRLIAITLGMLAVTLLFQAVLLSGAGAVLASGAYHGQAVALADGLRAALGERFAALVGGHAAVGGVLVGLLIASFLTITLCVGIFGLGVTAYVYLAWFPLLAPVLVLERGRVGVLMQRAWYFGKKRIWLLFGAVAAFLLVRFAALIAAALLSGLVGLILPAGAATWADALLFAAGQVIVMPLEAIFYTLLYEDTCSRFDPALLSPAARGPEPSAAGAGPEATAPAEPFLTAADLPNLVMVSMAALSLLFLLSLLLLPFTPF